MVRVEKLQQRHRQGLKALIKEVYAEQPSAFTFNTEPDDNQLDALLDKKLKLVKSSKLVDIVAEKEGRPIGECEIAVQEPERLGVIGIIVSSEERRKGIATALLYKSIEEAKRKGAKLFVAQVNKGNKPAIAFFKARGFRLAAKVQNYLIFKKAEY
ncbi:MAG: GNAT family N-acetyltransferase [Candidatus Micrarchaeia archaeon]